MSNSQHIVIHIDSDVVIIRDFDHCNTWGNC